MNRFPGWMIAGLFATVLIRPFSSAAAAPLPWDEQARLLMHISYLANDSRDGRGIGTAGLDSAAAYIARRFADDGLQPLFEGSYLQPFTIGWGATVLRGTSIAAGEVMFKVSSDFLPAGFSSTATVVKPLVFAGYGITADEYHYDDYQDIDASGKIVLAFDGEPRRNDPEALFAGGYDTDHSTPRTKAINAKLHGAAGLLIIPPPAQPDSLPPLSANEPYRDAGIPVAFLTRFAAAQLFPDFELDKLYRSIELNQTPRSMPLGDDPVSFAVELERNEVPIQNAGAMLPGDDRVILFGAHYDHLGYGQSGTRVPGVHEVHNGADDNASGVSTLLELARLSALNPPGPTVLFVAFTGEEAGLVGSSHFVDHPPLSLEMLNLMVNFDMVGRMQNNTLTVYGVKSAGGLMEFAQAAGAGVEVKLALSGGGYGASDQTSFYTHGIPVLHLLTALHGDYHRPTDDTDLISGAGLVKVLEYALSLETTFAEQRPVFLYQAASEPSEEHGTSYHVSMGTIPDFTQPDSLRGFRLQGVRPGTPAEQAGLKAMDIIIAIDEILVDNIYDLTYAMGKYNPGDEVTIRYLRDGEEHSTKLTFAGRTPRQE